MLFKMPLLQNFRKTRKKITCSTENNNVPISKMLKKKKKKSGTVKNQLSLNLFILLTKVSNIKNESLPLNSYL